MTRWSKLVVACGLMVSLGVAARAQETGAEIYKSKCERCHGADGKSHTFEGRMTHAAVFSDPAIVGTSDADLIAVVESGKKKMPSFRKKLTDDQIAAVVAYIHTLQK